MIGKIFFHHRVIGREQIPNEGPLIIASNHGSYFDPPVVGISFNCPLYYLARRSLLSNWFAKWIFPRLNVVPVDQEHAEVGALKAVIRLIKEKKIVLIFPEGARSQDGQLQAGLPGVGFVVAKTGAPVLPVRVFGAWEALPPITKKIRFNGITVVFGPVIHFSEEERAGKNYQAISDRIMGEIAKLSCPQELLPPPRELGP